MRYLLYVNYLLSPHLLKHEQWKVCEHGTVTSPVTEASILSRHTGHVGSSYIIFGLALDRLITADKGSSNSMFTDRTRTMLHVSGCVAPLAKSLIQLIYIRTNLYGIELLTVEFLNELSSTG